MEYRHAFRAPSEFQKDTAALMFICIHAARLKSSIS